MDGFGNVFGPFELGYSLTELADLVRDRCQRLGQRVGNLFGIGNDHALSFAEHDVSRNANNRGLRRNIAKDDRTRADAAILSNDNVAENLGSAADDNVVFERGMAFAVFFAGAAMRDSLLEGNVVADDRCFSDHDAHTVIDKETASEFCAGMDFNSSEKAGDLRQPPSD